MNKQNLIIIATIFLSLFISFLVIAQSSSPTPTSTGSPTSSGSPTNATNETATNKTNATTCSGQASMEFTSTKKKDFGEDDTLENLAKNLKSGVIDINNQLSTNEHIQDFIACTYPSDFATSCPKDKCIVDKTLEIYGNIKPPPSSTDSSSQGASYSTSGVFTFFISWLRLAGIGITGGNIESAIDSIMSQVMQELQRIADQVSSQYKCPDGYARSVRITIDSVEYEKGLFGITFKVHYTIYITCVKLTDTPTSVDLELHYKLTKTCIGEGITVTLPPQ